MQEQIQPFLISFLIGLLIGIDRERTLPEGLKGMGVRSFILIAMLGTLVALINELALSFTISAFIVVAILMNYQNIANVQAEKKALGITTGFAGATVYVLGFLAFREPGLASVIGMVILVILLSRKRLHLFAKEKLQPKEIRAGATLFVIFICVLVLIPDRPIDPWQLFNPKRFGMLVAIIAAMQFTGYIAIRMFGNQLGMMFVGFFGGLVSSTALFATLPSFVKQHPGRMRIASATAVLATIAKLLEFALIILIATPNLFLTVIKPISIMILTGVILAISLYRREKVNDDFETPANPLDVKSVLILSLVIGGMIIAIAITKTYLGVEGVQIVSFLGALFDLHSVSLATATLYDSGKLALNDATTTLFLAILASFITKFLILFGFARNRFGLITTIMLSLMLLMGSATLLFLG